MEPKERLQRWERAQKKAVKHARKLREELAGFAHVSKPGTAEPSDARRDVPPPSGFYPGGGADWLKDWDAKARKTQEEQRRQQQEPPDYGRPVYFLKSDQEPPRSVSEEFVLQSWQMLARKAAEQSQAAPQAQTFIRWEHDGEMIVRPDGATLTGAGMTDKVMLRTVMRQFKSELGGEAELMGGTAEFKLTAWAVAQLVGVKITNYDPPDSANRQKAEMFIAQHQGLPDWTHDPTKPPRMPTSCPTCGGKFHPV